VRNNLFWSTQKLAAERYQGLWSTHAPVHPAFGPLKDIRASWTFKK